MSEVVTARAGLFNQARYVDRTGSAFTVRVNEFEEAVRAEERAARASLVAFAFRQQELICEERHANGDPLTCDAPSCVGLRALAGASTPAPVPEDGTGGAK